MPAVHCIWSVRVESWTSRSVSCTSHVWTFSWQAMPRVGVLAERKAPLQSIVALLSFLFPSTSCCTSDPWIVLLSKSSGTAASDAPALLRCPLLERTDASMGHHSFGKPVCPQAVHWHNHQRSGSEHKSHEQQADEKGQFGRETVVYRATFVFLSARGFAWTTPGPPPLSNTRLRELSESKSSRVAAAPSTVPPRVQQW